MESEAKKEEKPVESQVIMEEKPVESQASVPSAEFEKMSRQMHFMVTTFVKVMKEQSDAEVKDVEGTLRESAKVIEK